MRLIHLLAYLGLIIGCGSAGSGSAGSTGGGGDGGGGGNGGGDGDDGSIDCEPTTESIQTTIFTPTCGITGCHDTEAAGGLDLTAPDVLSRLVDQPAGTCDGEIRIVPGDPQGSFLFEKVAGTPTCGDPMPPGSPLPDNAIQCLQDWITGLESTCETCGETTCVDLQSDPEHCGACDQTCPEGIACQEGACACPEGTELCAGTCVDLDANPDHCGSCDNACEADQACAGGVCTSDCGDLTNCDGACVDLQQNSLHCGSCDNACNASQSCMSGTCSCTAEALGYAADIEPILTTDCASSGCHASQGARPPAADLELSSGNGHAALVEVPSTQCASRLLVDPGAPGASYLVDKVKGVNLCSGSRMPKSGPGLSSDEIAMISGWICNGADP